MINPLEDKEEYGECTSPGDYQERRFDIDHSHRYEIPPIAIAQGLLCVKNRILTFLQSILIEFQ